MDADAGEHRTSVVVGDLGDPEEAGLLLPPLGLALPSLEVGLPFGLPVLLLLSLLSLDDDGLILPKIFLRDLVPENLCRPRVTAARRSARDFLLDEEEDAFLLLLLLLLLLLGAVISCWSEAVGVATIQFDTTGALVPLPLGLPEVAAAATGDATLGLEAVCAALLANGEPLVEVAVEVRVSTSIGPGILFIGGDADFGTDPGSLFSSTTGIVATTTSATAAGSTAGATLRLLIWKTISPSSEESSS